MRILFADTTIGGDLIGGAQTFLARVMGGLFSSGHEVHLLADGEGEGRIRDLVKASGAEVHFGLCGGGELVDDLSPVIAGWINDLRPDVYVISVSPDIGWTVSPHLDPGIATMTIGHNDERTFYDPVRHYAPFLTRAIGVSDTICRKYVDECGMESERVEWIPYGVETLSRFNAVERRVADRPGGEEPIRLAYVGRFENTQKRIADIVAIARRLESDGVSFEFDLVGDGEAMPDVRAALSGLIEQGIVRIHGWVPSDRVIQKLRESEVFVLASAYEGFCISLIESMANGCVPVVTDIESGNKQLVDDGVNGFIVPVGDVDSFVDRIKALAADRNRLSEMRERAWYTGREYSVDRMVESYERCFEASVEDTRINPRTPDPNFPLMESCRSKYPLWIRRLKAKAKAFVTT
ncbi:MAG: glycosyltransferase family 4 protein [Pyrinomonadaceae bacterium]